MTDVVELESAQLMERFSDDRQNFMCVRHCGLAGKRHYQVMSLPKGFLFIDLPTSKLPGQPGAMELGMAAGVGRLLGGHVGSQVAQIAVMGASSGGKKQVDQTFELANDEELMAVVGKRKWSFCVPYEHVKWATIDVNRAMSTAAGLIRFKAKKVGKVEVEPLALDDMFSAIDSFPNRLGSRVKVRAEFDPRRRRFVKRRKK